MIAVAIRFRLTRTAPNSAALLTERAEALGGTAGLVQCCLHCPARPDGHYQLVTCWSNLEALDRWLRAPTPCGACPGCPALPAAAQVVTLDIIEVVAPQGTLPGLLAPTLCLSEPHGWG
jgi:hypothetical protein